MKKTFLILYCTLSKTTISTIKVALDSMTTYKTNTTKKNTTEENVITF